MKKYRVNVNGTVYEVELEEITGGAVAAPAAAAAPVATPAAPASAPAGGEQITSPMPGNILSVNVAAGDTVKKGQVLMILEAMKMENEIMSPCDGKVVSVSVAKGAAVESGTLLCVIG
ncbi:MAG: biotin/lipoyl-binding protein [Clostridiales bacterium]|nr:biotin/lipoyl-binding protein [Clostridiales bacterium]